MRKSLHGVRLVDVNTTLIDEYLRAAKQFVAGEPFSGRLGRVTAAWTDDKQAAMLALELPDTQAALLRAAGLRVGQAAAVVRDAAAGGT